jgi:PIN domain nuclease of toxin-antitoxin system
VILIDSHIVVWLAGEPERISRKAHEAISAARQDGSGLGIAGITLWEVAMLLTRGRITAKISLESLLKEIEENFVVIPLTSRIAARSMEFAGSYPKDPADRIIGATAVVEGLSLVTRDERIRASREVPTIW